MHAQKKWPIRVIGQKKYGFCGDYFEIAIDAVIEALAIIYQRVYSDLMCIWSVRWCGSCQ